MTNRIPLLLLATRVRPASMIVGLALTLLSQSILAVDGTTSGCSEYIGDATLNEVANLKGDQWIEVRILDDDLEAGIWNDWTVATGTKKNDFVYNLKDAEVNDVWLKLDVHKNAVDLKDGMEIALFDADGQHIDYLSINGATENAPANCEFEYGTSIDSAAQYKFVHRVEDGTGDWKDPDSPGASDEPTPGASNDGNGEGDNGAQKIDASSPQYEGDGAALYTRVVDQAFGVTVRYDADEPEPDQVRLNLVRDDDGDCGEVLKENWGKASAEEFEETDDGYEVTLTGLEYSEAVARARLQIHLDVESSGGGGLLCTILCFFNPSLSCCGDDNTQQTTLEECSSDAFTIRPAGLSLSATTIPAKKDLTRSDSEWSDYSPTNCSDEACQAAGKKFNLSLTGPQGFYFDNPVKFEVRALSEPELQDLPLNVPDWMTPGNLGPSSPTFDAVEDSTLDGVTYRTKEIAYDEVGVMAVDAHDKGAFTIVDHNEAFPEGKEHCVPGEAKNNIGPDGLVGCRTALSEPEPLGRFIPGHFKVVGQTIHDRWKLREETECTADNFTYLGEELAAEVTLEARDAAGTRTQNYRGDYASLRPDDAEQWAAIDGWTGTDLNGLTDRTAPRKDGFETVQGWPEETTESDSGEATFRFPLTVERRVDQDANPVPDGPWTDVAFRFTASDLDGVAVIHDLFTEEDDSPDDEQVTELRYGRLAMESGHAAEFADLDLALISEYWAGDGDGFVTNGDDDCTPLADGSGSSRFRYRSAASGDTFGDWADNPSLGDTNATEPTSLNGGAATLTLSAPAAPEKPVRGRVEVCLDLRGLDFLHHTWPTPAPMPTDAGQYEGTDICDGSPVARATFGVGRGNEDVIFTREIFR